MGFELIAEMLDRMRQRIRLCLDCADMCLAAGTIGIPTAGSNEPVIIAAMQACAVACGRCA